MSVDFRKHDRPGVAFLLASLSGFVSIWAGISLIIVVNEFKGYPDWEPDLTGFGICVCLVAALWAWIAFDWLSGYDSAPKKALCALLVSALSLFVAFWVTVFIAFSACDCGDG